VFLIEGDWRSQNKVRQLIDSFKYDKDGERIIQNDDIIIKSSRKGLLKFMDSEEGNKYRQNLLPSILSRLNNGFDIPGSIHNDLKFEANKQYTFVVVFKPIRRRVQVVLEDKENHILCDNYLDSPACFIKDIFISSTGDIVNDAVDKYKNMYVDRVYQGTSENMSKQIYSETCQEFCVSNL